MHLVEKPPLATSYYTSADAGEALFAYLRTTARAVRISDEFVFSIWPARPIPGGGPGPAWIVEHRRKGEHLGWISDGRPSGPYTYPPGSQQRL